ncbi:hypothetical protein HNP32_002471 [Brevundimonas bullata]|uniref:Uncharacterized protein n=1 Tax=Brevundimonas bullata TaxID=13160 RepID=A0A7W7IR38_9CAUL|nr:hypothetical protein [Brevundimonas bullata]MBB4798717.1 hypothetical protein [Brevundimonas bullata]MBB6383677.1 hypothetical protein [Brevundimonas bullata]
MSIRTQGVAHIRHAETDEVFAIEADELDWNQVGGEERGMGDQITYSAEIAHPDLGDLAWWAYEYPVGMLDHTDKTIGPHKMLQNFKFELVDSEFADQEARIQSMVSWFHARFEDPSQSTPYNGREGGFLYIHGGPYDARDELEKRFPDEDETLIDLAIQEIESDGLTEWAPVRGQDDDRETPLEAAGVLPGSLRAAEAFRKIMDQVPDDVPGPIFASAADGRIDLTGWSGEAFPEGELLSALREHTADIISDLAGTNAHQDLLHALRKYQLALEEGPVSTPLLYTRGVFLDNTANQVGKELVEGDRPPLPGPVPSRLHTLRELHGALIVSSEEGAALVEAAARYRRTTDEQVALTRAVVAIAEAIRATPEVFGPGALAVAEEAAANVGRGAHPDRSNQAAKTIMERLLARTGWVAGFAITAVSMTIVGDGVAASMIGQQAQGLVTAVCDGAFEFLIAHLDTIRTFAAVGGADTVWLRHLNAWLALHRYR